MRKGQKRYNDGLSASQRMYRRRREKGLCGVCGKTEPPNNRALCDDCRIRNDKYRAAFRLAGVCIMCRINMADAPSSRCKHCLEDNRLKMRAVLQERYAAGLCKCGQPPLEGRKSCKRCRDIAKARGQRLKRRVLTAYGLKCAHCGEDNLRLLSLDHVSNDGKQHRLSLKKRHSKQIHKGNVGMLVYADVVRRGFPAGFQTLCIGCNLTKHALGGKLPEKPKVDPFYTERDLDSM